MTQVEGLKDLLNAETEAQRRIALKAAGVRCSRLPFQPFTVSEIYIQGVTRAQYDELRSSIICCLANIEALIDFGEGEDLEEGVYEQGSVSSRHLYSHPTSA